MCILFFFLNDTATTEIYTLSLPDPLPISTGGCREKPLYFDSFRSGRMLSTISLLGSGSNAQTTNRLPFLPTADRKSTRLNSSHANISYAVFCLKKKKQITSRYSMRAVTSQ